MPHYPGDAVAARPGRLRRPIRPTRAAARRDGARQRAQARRARWRALADGRRLLDAGVAAALVRPRLRNVVAVVDRAGRHHHARERRPMTMEISGAARPERPRVTVQAVFGLMVIAVGVLFTLDNLDIIDAREYLRFWPVGLVAIGLLKLYHAARGGQGWVGGLFFLTIGVWWLIEGIVYIRVDAREVMPDRKSTRLNSSHLGISYAVFCLKKKKNKR